MVDFGVELYVGRKTAPERISWTGDESVGELLLKHEDSDAEDGPVREQLEHERR